MTKATKAMLKQRLTVLLMLELKRYTLWLNVDSSEYLRSLKPTLKRTQKKKDKLIAALQTVIESL